MVFQITKQLNQTSLISNPTLPRTNFFFTKTFEFFDGIILRQTVENNLFTLTLIISNFDTLYSQTFFETFFLIQLLCCRGLAYFIQMQNILFICNLKSIHESFHNNFDQKCLLVLLYISLTNNWAIFKNFLDVLDQNLFCGLKVL